jgi:acyl carrier protein
MDKAEILKRMNDLFVEVLDDTQIVLSEATTADDVDGWDSLTHVQLVLAVEQHFKIRFTAREIRSWSNVGEMIACVISKQR